MSEHLRQQWHEAAGAKSLVRHQVNAEDVREGDFLDSSGKVRVHHRHTRGDRVMLGWKLRGSRAPGVRIHQKGETVNVWRKA